MQDIVDKLRATYIVKCIETPDILTTYDENDYYIAIYLKEILSCVVSLISTRSYPDYQLDNIVNKCDECMDSIVVLVNGDSNKTIIISNFIIKFTEKIRSKCMAEELYETIVNIDRFNKKFYRA